MSIINVRHQTTYRYARAVHFGEHRLMCRPRDSHDLRLLDTRLSISPPAEIRWLHDAFGNSIAVARFRQPADTLVLESGFRAEHYPAQPGAIELEAYARACPFSYSAEEIPDLARCIERHYPDPQHEVDAWARRLLQGHTSRDSLELLLAMCETIRAQFAYRHREEMGTQTPLQTLREGGGSCRDFALFMIEAARSLGLAARFVSGYLYDEKLVGAGGGLVGAGATHAWVQIYLPGAGWVEFDPTNALVGGRNLIRVAVARDAGQAIPITGTYIGAPSDFVNMGVVVEVRADDPPGGA